MKIVSIEKANGSHRWLNLDQVVEVSFLKDKQRVRLEFANSSQIIVMREDFDKWDLDCDHASAVIEFPE